MTDTRITVESPTAEQLARMGVHSWPVWEKEISRFDWHYEEREQCYFLEGRVVVRTDRGELRIGVGDLVTFAEGLDCNWEVLEPVRKHYRFG